MCAHRLVVENHSFLSLASRVQNHHRRGIVCTPNSKISRRHTRPVDIGRPSPPQDANTDRFLRLYSAAVAFSAGCLCWLPMGNHARQRAATRSRRAGRTVYSEPVSEPVVRWSVPRVFFMPSERKTPPDTGTVPVLVAELGRLVAYRQLGNQHARHAGQGFF